MTDDEGEVELDCDQNVRWDRMTLSYRGPGSMIWKGAPDMFVLLESAWYFCEENPWWFPEGMRLTDDVVLDWMSYIGDFFPENSVATLEGLFDWSMTPPSDNGRVNPETLLMIFSIGNSQYRIGIPCRRSHDWDSPTSWSAKLVLEHRQRCRVSSASFPKYCERWWPGMDHSGIESSCLCVFFYVFVVVECVCGGGEKKKERKKEGMLFFLSFCFSVRFCLFFFVFGISWLCLIAG